MCIRDSLMTQENSTSDEQSKLVNIKHNVSPRATSPSLKNILKSNFFNQKKKNSENSQSVLKDNKDINNRVSNDQMKIHKGPMNLRCLTTKEPKQIMSSITKTLEQLKMYMRQTNKYEIKCEKDKLKLDIQINQVQDLDKLFLIKFARSQGENDKFNDICNNILVSLGM
eukprot:TRINITY_DN5291_c0_g1_i2.p1 TRINITY_DN5291_c0_g1~~TRINITY_DN5291_c0_g1_i2.p1  ORF type:complete len:169 (+),score=31.73 TRINITY_DN5291_c0_g1_i2:132-638(+)